MLSSVSLAVVSLSLSVCITGCGLSVSECVRHLAVVSLSLSVCVTGCGLSVSECVCVTGQDLSVSECVCHWPGSLCL